MEVNTKFHIWNIISFHFALAFDEITYTTHYEIIPASQNKTGEKALCLVTFDFIPNFTKASAFTPTLLPAFDLDRLLAVGSHRSSVANRFRIMWILSWKAVLFIYLFAHITKLMVYCNCFVENLPAQIIKQRNTHSTHDLVLSLLYGFVPVDMPSPWMICRNMSSSEVRHLLSLEGSGRHNRECGHSQENLWFQFYYIFMIY